MYNQRPLITYTLTYFEAGVPKVERSKSFQQLLGIALDAGKSAHPVIVDEDGNLKFPKPDKPNDVVIVITPEYTLYEPLKLVA